MNTHSRLRTARDTSFAIGALLAVSVAAPQVYAGGYGGPYGFGAVATEAEIAAIDIDATPDGSGLPPGEGKYEQGKEVYMQKCAACHGQLMEGIKATGGAALIGGRGSIGTDEPKKTVESYWPYATTLFDFTKRAMPFNTPGSLSDEEVYSVTAYILAEGKIIDKDAVMNARTLPQVQMPNRDGFVSDPRPDIFNYD
ncbi:MAG: c-type cytochrome [Gammaproteobacteria bacterium]